jgi:predicted nuclease of predicted toxin-antitoxin system
MGYRILVDENLDPQTVLFLRNRGHDAVHVEETLGKGTSDELIAEYARDEGYVVLTNDRDFLDPERNRELTVLLVAPEGMRPNRIAEQVDTLAELAQNPSDLGRVTWISE